jgi:hypothetical protein
VGGTAAILAYALTGNGWHRLPIFLSGACLASLAAAQWALLLGDPPAWVAILRERLPVKKVAALEDGSGHPVVG